MIDPVRNVLTAVERLNPPERADLQALDARLRLALGTQSLQVDGATLLSVGQVLAERAPEAALELVGQLVMVAALWLSSTPSPGPDGSGGRPEAGVHLRST